MSAFADCFVGCDCLPTRLSEFDREHFFSLTKADVEAVKQQFREGHQLAAALMVLFMRVAGRPLDGFTVLPRNLLRYAAGALGVAAPSIASLRSIYRRKQTLFSHQRWAKEYLGLTELEAAQEQDLVSALEVQAQDAAHTDDLVQLARHWLFTRRILIPSNRRLLDWARDAFAKIEAQIVLCVADAVGRVKAAKLLLLVYALRPGTDVSRIEWLKTPPRRHSPTTLAETMEKVRYLKSLGVHEWDLSGVVLARQQAYTRQIQARRPYRSRDIKMAAQLACPHSARPGKREPTAAGRPCQGGAPRRHQDLGRARAAGAGAVGASRRRRAGQLRVAGAQGAGRGFDPGPRLSGHALQPGVPRKTQGCRVHAMAGVGSVALPP
jgi:hypothetical protein